MSEVMIPAGYMYKQIIGKPDWIKSSAVKEIYSVSNCISHNFADFMQFWKNNGFWFYNSQDIILEIAKDNQINLTKSTAIYYEVFNQQFNEDSKSWESYKPETDFVTNISIPTTKLLLGYDVVTFSVQTCPECSPLSCNMLADELTVNNYCLFDNFNTAKTSIENGSFTNSEAGSFRIFAVYKVS